MLCGKLPMSSLVHKEYSVLTVVQYKPSRTRLHSSASISVQVGIMLVGLSSVLSGEGSSTHEISPQKMLLGMALIVMSQV